MTLFYSILKQHSRVSQQRYNLYKTVMNINTYDVSLTDGLNMLNVNYRKKITTKHKFNLYKYIIRKPENKYIEIADLTTSKRVPHKENTYRFIEKCIEYHEQCKTKPKLCVKVYSSKMVQPLLDIGVKNISLYNPLIMKTNVSHDFMYNYSYNIEIDKTISKLQSVKDGCLHIYIDCLNEYCNYNYNPTEQIVRKVVDYYFTYKDDIHITLVNYSYHLSLQELNNLIVSINRYAGYNIAGSLSFVSNDTSNVNKGLLQRELMFYKDLTTHIVCEPIIKVIQ